MNILSIVLIKPTLSNFIGNVCIEGMVYKLSNVLLDKFNKSMIINFMDYVD